MNLIGSNKLHAVKSWMHLDFEWHDCFGKCYNYLSKFTLASSNISILITQKRLQDETSIICKMRFS